jgi:methylated-DNA-[protein]-cysteine S-methyltransferase
MGELCLDTPLGPLTLIAEADAIAGLEWREGGNDRQDCLVAAAGQLSEYFFGTRTTFELPLRPGGSTKQQQFLAALARIPHGQTRTYGEMAEDLDISAQAAGQFCGANPIPILIPCHRVVGKANLGGYSGAGGIETKVWLLRHERAGGLLI